ncbi:MAG: Sec-independent protein translocase subunit TatA/TatB [Thermoleophilaceae bacterium]|nr:twin-arginine translocase TatA/TatE family subunit [Thermoleophilaceae bacterium]
MPSVGPMEIVIIMVIALIVLGPKKLPEMGRSVGRGMREFKNAVSMDTSDDDDSESESRRSKKDREQVGSGG